MAEAKEASVVVTKVKVKVGKDTHDWTIQEAKKLYEALGELFANPAVVTQKEYIFWNYPPYKYEGGPTIPWNQPTWTMGISSNDSTYGQVSSISTEIK